jgi:hypothetical protein
MNDELRDDVINLYLFGYVLLLLAVCLSVPAAGFMGCFG